MRRPFAAALFVALIPTAGFAQESASAQGTEFSGIRHSTIDRSAFPAVPDEIDGKAVGDSAGGGDAEEFSSPIRPVSQSPEIGRIESPAEPMAPEPVLPSLLAPEQPWIVPTHWRFVGTFLPAGDNDIGLFDYDLRGAFTVPSVEGLTITPGFQMHFVDGPTRTDLPERLYNARAEIRYKRQLSRPVWIEGAVAPGVYSDFDVASSDAFRIIVQGLGFFAFSYQTQAVIGLTYLDRDDVEFLPVVGLIHSPNERTRLNLVFPAPKLSYRFRQDGQGELWGYLAGEFGGGSWAIERPTRAFIFPPGRPGRRIRVPPREDVANYKDWRIIVGVEHKTFDGRTLFVEAGLVFNRELEYNSGVGDFDPDSTAMLRAGLHY